MKTELLFHRMFTILFLCLLSGALVIVGAIFYTLYHYRVEFPRKQQQHSKLSALITRASPFVMLESPGYSFATASSSLFLIPTPSPTPPSFMTWVFNRQTPQVSPTSLLDETKVRDWIQQTASLVDRPASPASIQVGKDGKLIVFAGSHGSVVNQSNTLTELMARDLQATSSSPLVFLQTGTVLTQEEVVASGQRIEKLSKLATVFITPKQKFTVSKAQLATLIQLPTGYNQEAVKNLISSWSKETNTQPQEPKLTIEDGVVKEFIPPLDGLTLEHDSTTQHIISVLTKLENDEATKEVGLTLTPTSPTTSLASTNTLGIEERIGKGDSAYDHSIANRIHNVALTTSKIHAKLIMPGEEFSFNKYLGDVSKETGFKPAYIIKEGQTVLGDGGGVCQVSSTLFRAVMNAGLPITERRGHSYRVSYYEQNSKPGFDATVYSPHPDFRFKNDTNNPILINGVTDSKNLTMYIELYGKSDGRKAEITNYTQSSAVPPPPPLYQDDPSLPPGKVRQIEYAASGLKTSFEYVVTYGDGKIQSKKFSTNYVPWRAVYLRGSTR